MLPQTISCLYLLHFTFFDHLHYAKTEPTAHILETFVSNLLQNAFNRLRIGMFEINIRNNHYCHNEERVSFLHRAYQILCECPIDSHLSSKAPHFDRVRRFSAVIPMGMAAVAIMRHIPLTIVSVVIKKLQYHGTPKELVIVLDDVVAVVTIS